MSCVLFGKNKVRIANIYQRAKCTLILVPVNTRQNPGIYTLPSITGRNPLRLAFACPCPSALPTGGALKGTVLSLAQGSLPVPYSSCSPACQIYSTRSSQWDYKRSCVGFRLQPLVTPTRAETWEARAVFVYTPASRAEVGPETRLRAWGPSYPGSWDGSGRRKKADAGDRGRPWWSTKQKLSTEFTSSCRIYRFCNKGIILGGKTQYKNPLQQFWSLLGDEEYLETGRLAVLMMEWLNLATPILNIYI